MSTDLNGSVLQRIPYPFLLFYYDLPRKIHALGCLLPNKGNILVFSAAYMHFLNLHIINNFYFGLYFLVQMHDDISIKLAYNEYNYEPD